MNKTISIFFIMSLFGLGGCASPTINSTVSYMKAGGDRSYYGMVYGENDGQSELKKKCTESRIRDELEHICANPTGYKVVFTNPYKLGAIDMHVGIVAPSTVSTPKGSIVEYVQLDSVLPTFVRVAATEETETCRWTGLTSNNAVRAGTGFLAALAGFVPGMQLVTGAVLFGTDVGTGGVECNGWSYKDLIKDAKEHSQTAGIGVQSSNSM